MKYRWMNDFFKTWPRKKKNKAKKVLKEPLKQTDVLDEKREEVETASSDKRTPAQIAFDKMQEKRVIHLGCNF